MFLLLPQHRKKKSIPKSSQNFRTFKKHQNNFLFVSNVKVSWNSYVADRCHLIEVGTNILAENLVEFNHSPVQK